MSTENLQTVANIIEASKKAKGFHEDKELAEWLGVSNKVLSAWKKREKIANYDVFVACGFSVDWLRTGEGEMFRQRKGEKEIQETANQSDTITINVYAMAGAGMPQTLSDYEPIETFNLPARFAKPNITPIKIEGRSMEPMIVDGAIVGVDRDDLHVVSGEIYAVWLPYEGAVVKRLYMGANNIILRSDNPNFPEITIPVPEIGQDHLIMGRVKWVLQEF